MKAVSRQRWIIITLVVMLVLLSLFNMSSGAWFTDREEINSEVETPIINPVIYTKNGDSYSETGILYWNKTSFNDTLNKPIYFGFKNDINVTNLVVRFLINVEWGTYKDDKFTLDTSLPYDSRVLKPDGTFTTNFTKGYQCGYEEMVKMVGQANADEIYAQVNTDYYRKLVITTTPNELKNTKYPVYNSLVFNETQYPNYSTKTARISFKVEVDFANSTTIGETDGTNLTVPGKWSPIVANERQDGAPISWIKSIKAQEGYKKI